MVEPEDSRGHAVSGDGERSSADRSAVVSDAGAWEGPAPTPAGALLDFAGTWVGDDLDECLSLVYRTRGKAQF
jgi:hypothetical protein